MKKFKEKGMQGVFTLSAILAISTVILICGFLFMTGLPAIWKIGIPEFLLGTVWRPQNDLFGIFPMIIASIIVTGGAILLAVPIGVFTAAYMARFASQKTLKIFRPAIQLLAGIPSVVYGFFGIIVIVPTIHKLFGVNGSSLLAAILILTIMILPTIINISEAAIATVPKSYYEGAVALGVSHERSVFFILVRAAKQGILAGIILAIGRAIGETMAVIMVVGNQPKMPTSLLLGGRPLTANIAMEMGYATDMHRQALIATGVILFIFILIINILFSFVKRSELK